MKICATTLGETAGDLLSMTLDVGYAWSSVLLLSVFLATLVAQLAAVAFHPWLYWAVILSTSTAGTTISDFMDRTLGLGYATGTAILATTLVLLLGVWRAVTGSLSVQELRDRRSEIFYWLTILVSNAAGTALGVCRADVSGLGVLGGALVIGSAIALVALRYKTTRIDRGTLFWAAFVLTRPFGATFGDQLTKGADRGGHGLGT